LDTIQAAILLAKLGTFINNEIDSVNRVAEKYTASLKNYVQAPSVPEGYHSSWAQYTIKLPNRSTRDALIAHLSKNKIPSKIYYPIPLHRQKAFIGNPYVRDSEYVNSDFLADTVLSLPMHPYLEDVEIDSVTSMLIEFLT